MTSEQPPDAGPLDPDQARQNPEEAVDALERRTLGGTERRLDDGYPDDVAPDDKDVDAD